MSTRKLQFNNHFIIALLSSFHLTVRAQWAGLPLTAARQINNTASANALTHSTVCVCGCVCVAQQTAPLHGFGGTCRVFWWMKTRLGDLGCRETISIYGPL